MFKLPTYNDYYDSVKKELKEVYKYPDDVLNEILSDEETVDWYIKSDYELIKKLYKAGEMDEKEYLYRVHISANGINLEN